MSSVPPAAIAPRSTMSKQGVPDAWDDDWTNVADTQAAQEPEPAPKMSKAQRRQQHLEQQKQLWDGAENPARNHWLEAQGVVPLKQEFKPPVQLLSRKPAAPVIARRDGTNGALDDGEDSEEETKRKQQADLEERQRKAKIEREEKEKKYAEARARIMGSSTPSSPAPSKSRESSHGRDNRRSRPKANGKVQSQPTSADQSPARAPALASRGNAKALFDPDDMGRRLPAKGPASSPAPKDDQPSRQPRGPDSGRGGFGFAARGGGPTS